ncbi:MAG: PaaI family thioesterase [Actinomycetota bacterium]
MSTEPAPRSAMELAKSMGDSIPSPDSISTESHELIAVVRELLDAVMRTDVDDAAKSAIAADIKVVNDRLRTKVRHPYITIVRHLNGRIENVTQAGSGPLNPRAPILSFDPVPVPGDTYEPVEVTAHAVLDASMSGPPDKAHGGIVATMLDEVLGVASTAAGASGLTVALNIRFRAGTPLGVPLTVTARGTGVDGRKSFASGEVRHDDTVVAEATAVYVSVHK